MYVGIVIFCDAISALLAIKDEKDITFVTEIITKLSYQRKHIHLEWIPSHCGVHGNEMADFFFFFFFFFVINYPFLK